MNTVSERTVERTWSQVNEATPEDVQALIDAEAPPGDRRNKLIASYNRGYRGFQQTYRTCTPAARV